MNFVNKATLEVFPLAWTVMFLQMMATVAMVLPLWLIRAVDFPPLSWEKARQLAPVSIFYALNTAFALLGLRTLNIPMYSTLKRLTPMIVLALRAAVTWTLPSCGLTTSVVCVVAGCIVAGVGDLTFHAMGYMYALSSCLLQAIYLLLVEFRGTHQKVGSAEMLFYNALLSLPFLLLAVVISGEYTAAGPLLSAAVGSSPSFLVLLAMCSMLGTLLNLSLFLCTINNSALTTTVVGVMKGVLTTALGFFLLGGVPVTAVNTLGIALNTAGGVSYSILKFRERAGGVAKGSRSPSFSPCPSSSPSPAQPAALDPNSHWSSPQNHVPSAVHPFLSHVSAASGGGDRLFSPSKGGEEGGSHTMNASISVAMPRERSSLPSPRSSMAGGR
eukprot:CAMPEP_0117661564 /NCGR_PEP_ID=MMETSP0804-20121206/7604_1 /TAXON_ID=1074897 /ORGANISM="Tetraselmis astigmatica, Strain CCMP880" /LENGTH=385 /DNA_ID=CAMNT_0005468439 /DNA_START=1318 /DNA_END=2475 /DNA_ORIENTATION=-